MWEMLRDIHSESYGYGLDGDEVDEIIGPDAAEREIQHAMIVLEMLMRAKSTIRKNAAARPVQSVCATPGCPNLTTEYYCMHCELGLKPE
ncbi:hypothetical protein Ato02nite_098050 [Paractinoplanes toevensis]|uniref:Uncharacterized protein n=1 Tax=Paractinoplanes toevensis TaxID=571911 RepID=A0A919WD94_9ACTN|nr:hypothetical protein Ato02nite_098050 [Actinoplanes toevensis]